MVPLMSAESELSHRVPQCRAADTSSQGRVYGASEGVRKPALLWMHGGALILGNRTGITRPFHAGPLEQGYVIVSIGYRLAPETKLPAIIEDVQDAWKWVHEQARRFGIDRGPRAE